MKGFTNINLNCSFLLFLYTSIIYNILMKVSIKDSMMLIVN